MTADITGTITNSSAPAGAGAPAPQPAAPREIVTNTVRISGADLLRLEEEMDAKNPGGSPRRSFLRWPFPKEAVLVEMIQPSGATSRLRYACRNLSTTGIGILHSTYVHIGTKCIVHLPRLDGGVATFAAIVARCMHYRGVIHEVGLKFDAALNVREYVGIDPMRGGFTMEHVDPGKLTGSLLHIDDSSMDRRLVRHHLRETNLNIVSAETASQALARASEGFDVIICEHDLPDMTGPALAESLRSQSIPTPIIMTTSDTRLAKDASQRSPCVSAYLLKPLTQEVLLRAMAEFMLMSRGDSDSGGPIYSTLAQTDSAFGFVPEFVEELREVSIRLGAGLEAKDTAALKRTCAQVRGAAKGVGFAIVGTAAESAVLALEHPDKATEWGRAVRALMGACARVKVKEVKVIQKAA
ncbi:hypothetical protein BH11PLA1_BH11PLA1_11100 [soil metagenome]